MRACSTPACPRRASSAARWAWRRPGSCRCPRSNSASTRIPPPSSSTTAARCAGAPPIDSPLPWWCASPADSSNAAIPGTANRTRCSGCTASAGASRCPRTPRTRWDCCAPRCAATIRRYSSSIDRCSTAAWARRAYPGDDFVVPFGRASLQRSGDALTVVTWGAMVERCELALERTGVRRRPLRPAHLVAVGQTGDTRVGAQDPSLLDRA